MESIVIVGAGIFGLTSSLELRRRGYSVTVVDPGPVPHPLASSNDTCRMVRMDYGEDGLYVELAEKAIQGWHSWNQSWGEEIYHETGFLLTTCQAMAPGTYEYDSFAFLSERGYNLQRLNEGLLAERFPRWNRQKYIDGYYNPRAGWVEAVKVVSRLEAEARACGVAMHTGAKISGLLEDGFRVTGVATSDGGRQDADLVVVAAGPWTPTLLPQLADMMQTVAQPLVYLKPADPDLFRGPGFPPWTADVSQTGWHGFPADDNGSVKIGNHGPGRHVGPDASRELPAEDVSRVREFLQDFMPELATAPLADSKICLYTDTWDGNFWIGRDPQREGLVVATGGSGHAFKFAPVLGGIIADVVDRVETPYTRRFAWRSRGESTSESNRYTGESSRQTGE